MKVVAQGMRRSGTTVVFDAFVKTGLFACFYEPLAAAKPSLGGGSGIRRVDPFVSVRALRSEFLKKNPHLIRTCPHFESANLLNYGAPRNAALEFEPDAPLYVWEYLSTLFEQETQVFAKFTRLHSKVDRVAQLLPAGYFIHIVRDPRSVVGSYLFGKNQRNRKNFFDLNHYFNRRSNMSAWSSRPFSEFLEALPDRTSLPNPTDLQRILMIWKYKYDSTHRLGIDAFRDRYILLRYEDFSRNPVGVMGELLDRLGFALPTTTRLWLEKNVRPATPPYAGEDPRWHTEFSALRMLEEVEGLKYV